MAWCCDSTCCSGSSATKNITQNPQKSSLQHTASVIFLEFARRFKFFANRASSCSQTISFNPVKWLYIIQGLLVVLKKSPIATEFRFEFYSGRGGQAKYSEKFFSSLISKYKARCVVAGYRQTAGLDYDPKGVYSPMAEPTTLRLVLAISSALKLNIDRLDIQTAFLSGENEQFFCSPPPGFRVPDGMGWLIKKGLYGAHQSGSIWAKTFRTWMHKNYPQYVEA